MKIFSHSYICKVVGLLMLVLSVNFTYAQTCFEPYYILDPHYFRFMDHLDQLATEQEFKSRSAYLKHRFGPAAWETKEDHFSFRVPPLVNSNYNIALHENLKSTNEAFTIYVFAETVHAKKKIYIEIVKLNISPNVSSYETSFSLLRRSDIFIVHKHQGKYIISGTKKISVSGTGCAGKVRTQQEANELNTIVCNKIPKHDRNGANACIEVDKAKLADKNLKLAH